MDIFSILSYDFLNVYDGDTETFAADWLLTGTQPSELITTGPDVYLKFESDGSETKTGFRIQYEPGKTLYTKIFLYYDKKFSKSIYAFELLIEKYLIILL